MAKIKSIQIGDVDDLKNVTFQPPKPAVQQIAANDTTTNFANGGITVPDLQDTAPTSDNALVATVNYDRTANSTWLLWQNSAGYVCLQNNDTPNTTFAPLWGDNSTRDLYLRTISDDLAWGYSG